LFITGIKCEQENLNLVPKKPVLYVCNHKSQSDIVGLIKILFEQQGLSYFSFVAKKELTKSKIVHDAMDLIDTVYLERDNLRQQYEAFNQQNELVKQGHSIVIFPEGTRVYQHEFLDFHAGALKAAYQNFIPIVPVTIYGSSGLLFDKNSRKEFKNKDKKIYFAFHKALQPSEFVITNEQYKAQQLHDMM